MIDILHRQVQLVLVAFRVAAVLAAPIREHTQQWDLVRIEQWHHPIIE
jgi:hypothetical protein